jgi:hypothetical protein
MQTLKRDYKEFFRATRDADKIANYVLAYEKDRARERNGAESEIAKISVSGGEASRTGSQTDEGAEADKEPFEPRIGQRVTFQPHEGTARLTGEVMEADENSVILQCGRATIPVFREKGIFAEASVPDTHETREYALEQASKHVGEKGRVFMAKGEDAIYRGPIVELTPAFAIQKVKEDVFLHRLKDLEDADTDHSLIRKGRNVSIIKGDRGKILMESQSNGEDIDGRSREKAASSRGR